MHNLVAEDEPAINHFIDRGLTGSLHDVEVALGHATSHHIALVILDRMFPGRDGVDVRTAARLEAGTASNHADRANEHRRPYRRA